MVPSTTPKISSGTTLEKFETGSAEKIFQGGIKVTRWYHFLPYLEHVFVQYFGIGRSHISNNQFQRVLNYFRPRLLS